MSLRSLLALMVTVTITSPALLMAARGELSMDVVLTRCAVVFALSQAGLWLLGELIYVGVPAPTDHSEAALQEAGFPAGVPSGPSAEVPVNESVPAA